jgi:hypothetical protein
VGKLPPAEKREALLVDVACVLIYSLTAPPSRSAIRASIQS